MPASGSVSGHDSLGVRRQLQVGDLSYDYFSLPKRPGPRSARSRACRSR